MQKFERQTEWGRDCYTFLDNNEIVPRAIEFDAELRKKWTDNSWLGGTYEQFKHNVELGDESLVSASEQVLAEIEDQIPMSLGWRNFDDVVGAVPNVPAFLAGHPQCMRRRERVMKETAPLFIFMDLTSTCIVDAADVRKRGIVLLALVRRLVEHRPVELWVGAQQGNYNLSGTTAWRIETAPLDLARAAFHIASPSMSRAFGYQQNYKMYNIPSCGPFPFYNIELHKRTGKQRLEALFPGQEIMFIPPLAYNDPMVKDAVGWVRDVMKRYTKEDE